jgi:hypothetical protein
MKRGGGQEEQARCVSRTFEGEQIAEMRTADTPRRRVWSLLAVEVRSGKVRVRLKGKREEEEEKAAN